MFPVPSNDAEPTTSPAIAIVLADASAVAVSALPVTSPVKFAIKVPVVCPVPEVFTVVVGSDWLPWNSLKESDADASHNRPAYFVVEPSTYWPYKPKSVAFAALSFATFTAPSVTCKVEDDTVVVLPDTVKFPDSVKLVAPTSPVTVKSFPIVTSSGNARVTLALSEPEPDTVISFAVPVISCT